MSLMFWKARAIELAVALFIVTAVITLSGEVADRQKELLPSEAWLTINEVYVPDFNEGGNPSMIYDRVIHENFNGFWIAEVQRKTRDGLWTTACSGHGANEYDPSEVIPDDTVTWQWYLGRPCAVPEGTYRLRTTYTMTRAGWPEKRLFNLSNEFRVLESE